MFWICLLIFIDVRIVRTLERTSASLSENATKTTKLIIENTETPTNTETSNERVSIPILKISTSSDATQKNDPSSSQQLGLTNKSEDNLKLVNLKQSYHPLIHKLNDFTDEFSKDTSCLTLNPPSEDGNNIEKSSEEYSVSNDIKPHVMSLSINESKASNWIPGINDSREELFGLVSNLDPEIDDFPDSFASSYEIIDETRTIVTLGETKFTVCAQYMLCHNRCPPNLKSNSYEERQSRNRRDNNDQEQQNSKHYRNMVDIMHERYKNTMNRPITGTKEGLKQEKRGVKPRPLRTRENQNTESHQELTRLRLKRQSEQVVSDIPCTAVQQNTTCYCDELCVLYGDCCMDVFQTCFQKTEASDILDFISDVKNKMNAATDPAQIPTAFMNFNKTYQSSHNFILSFASCVKVDVEKSMLLVSHCPSEFANTTLGKQCEEGQSMPLLPPVTVNLSGGNISFKNVYCAQCYGIETDALKLWSVQLNCGEELRRANSLTIPDINILVNSGECNVTFNVPPGICEPRRCDRRFRLDKEQKKLVEAKLQTGECTLEEAVLCQTYYFPIYDLQSPTCYTCLTRTKPRSQKNLSYDLCKNRSLQPSPFVTPPLAGGILIILDLTGEYTKGHEGTSFYVCANNEVYDPFNLVCKPLICAPGFEPYRGKCEDSTGIFFVAKSSQLFPDGWERLDVLTSTESVANYISCHEILNNTEVNTAHESFLVEKVQINDYQEVSWIRPENSSSPLCKCEEFVAKDESEYFQTVDLILSVTHKASLDTVNELMSLAESLVLLRPGSDNAQIRVTNMIKSPHISSSCTNEGILKERQNFTLLDHKGEVYAVFNSTQNGVYYPLNSIGYEFSITASTGQEKVLTSSIKVFICEASELLSKAGCSITVYWLNQTIRNESGLEVLSTGQYYSEGNFDVRGNQVYVCSNFEFKVELLFTRQSVTYVVVSCIFTVISVVFLLCMLVLYCLLTELRNLPGKMTANLAWTMMLTFMSNLFTLFDLHHDYICPVAAILSHVVTLAHFGWMSAIAVNMALTFGPRISSLTRNQNDSKLFLIYNILVWGSSVFLVMISAILDFTHPEGRKIEAPVTSNRNYPLYGNPFCTWFSGPLWTKLSFVIVPYFITYLISVTGFITTLVGIHESCKTSEKAGIKSSEKTRCLIYLKLSTAMGFSWILSLVANNYPEIHALSYIYVCLVLLQGVLLCLAFMANKKVFSLVTKKYCRKANTGSKSGTRISLIMTDTL